VRNGGTRRIAGIRRRSRRRWTTPAACRRFIGFAHIVRRSLFLELGGYRESFYFYGEEKDYCLRVLDAGFDIVYMPSARVVHAPNPSTRSRSRYVRYVIRNDCLFALYNEPLPLALLTLPIRLGRYRSMTRDFKDTGGFTWIVREIARLLPSIVGSRVRVVGNGATVAARRPHMAGLPQRSET
jgi:GT2 family glycosyltransferase